MRIDTLAEHWCIQSSPHVYVTDMLNGQGGGACCVSMSHIFMGARKHKQQQSSTYLNAWFKKDSLSHPSQIMRGRLTHKTPMCPTYQGPTLPCPIFLRKKSKKTHIRIENSSILHSSCTLNWVYATHTCFVKSWLSRMTLCKRKSTLCTHSLQS